MLWCGAPQSHLQINASPAVDEQVYVSAGVSVLLLTLALVAVSTFDNSSDGNYIVTEGTAGVTSASTATISAVCFFNSVNNIVQPCRCENLGCK